MQDAAAPTSANQFVEQQLDVRLAALEAVFDADALSLVGGLYPTVDDLIRTAVENLRQRNRGRGSDEQ